MQIEIAFLKDTAEAFATVSKALMEFAAGVKKAVIAGVRGYDEVSARKHRRDLLDLSRNLTLYASFSNAPVVRSIDEYLSRAAPNERDWTDVLLKVKHAADALEPMIADFRSIQGKFITSETYLKLADSFAGRQMAFEKFNEIPQPTEDAALDALRDMNNQYKLMVGDIRIAINELNNFLNEEYLNDLETEAIDFTVGMQT